MHSPPAGQAAHGPREGSNPPATCSRRKLAKDKLQELRRADARARLADAQLAVARRHGFTSWRKLRAHLGNRQLAEQADRVTELFVAIKRGEEAAVARLLVADPAPANARDTGLGIPRRPPPRRSWPTLSPAPARRGPHAPRSRARLHA